MQKHQRDWRQLIASAAAYGKAAGLTQNEIARRTGAHQKQISQLAAGKVEPRFGFALRFFEAVGIDLVLIAREKGHKTNKR